MSKALKVGDTPSPADLLAWLAQNAGDAYLVGGCIRDRLLGRPLHDLDVVVPSGGLALARRVANAFGGGYYPLDAGRGTGRALFRSAAGTPLAVDVSEFRGPDLPSDLAERDFTINALAERIAAPGQVIDLHHGMADLAAGTLRPVSPASIRDDPVRALRAVRLAAELGFSLAPETHDLIRRDGAGLLHIAGERIRDELCKVLVLPSAAPSLQLLDELGLLTLVFPELEPLRSLPDRAPGVPSGLAHSLEAVRALEGLLAPLLDPSARPAGLPPAIELWPRLLGALGPSLAGYLLEEVGDLRPRLATQKLAALLHNAGEPAAGVDGVDGRRRTAAQAEAGRRRAGNACRRLHLANPEVRLVECVVQHHTRPQLLLDEAGGQPGDPAAGPSHHDVSARAVYRFFRDTGDAGVAALLLALADFQAAPAHGGAPGAWPRLLGLVLRMMRDYFERYSEAVAPASLVDGHDLMALFGLAPGRRVGELLEAVREAQVAGEVADREQALALVLRILQQEASPSRQKNPS